MSPSPSLPPSTVSFFSSGHNGANLTVQHGRGKRQCMEGEREKATLVNGLPERRGRGGEGGHFPQHGAELEGRGTETWEMHAETEEEGEEKRRDPASLITILCIQDKRNGRSFVHTTEGRDSDTLSPARCVPSWSPFLFRKSVGIFSDLFGKMHDVRNSRFSSPIL